MQMLLANIMVYVCVGSGFQEAMPQRKSRHWKKGHSRHYSMLRTIGCFVLANRIGTQALT